MSVLMLEQLSCCLEFAQTQQEKWAYFLFSEQQPVNAVEMLVQGGADAFSIAPQAGDISLPGVAEQVPETVQ